MLDKLYYIVNSADVIKYLKTTVKPEQIYLSNRDPIEGFSNLKYHVWINLTSKRILLLDLTKGEAVYVDNPNVRIPIKQGLIPDIFGDGSCIAFYRFNGNAIDEINGYNGVLHGNEQYDTGVIDKAAKFDGKNLIELNTKLASDYLINKEFTISLLVKPNNTQQYYNYSSLVGLIHFAQCGSCGCCGTGIFITRNNSKTIGFCIADSPCGSGYGQNFENVMDITKFNHIVLTSNAFYLNGKQIITFTSKTFGSRIDGIAIGATYKDCFAHPPPPFVGLIDHLRIFNRTLNLSEVQLLYNERYIGA